ncbi:GDSL-type esterase/lipase family protein [Gloeothece verrucosa]|uniref:Lipolytic protein G-D-S-L family n=1 Tax=Gloeothece verrucosa (strain PCC 7822) TaxID=497965 RepID=E0U859_GLOV7|nr:GDSL-type esterase/lipase family protein [Gloeothece verrucosa]ADN17264.1 lipolytic protein G-D-S-L family [Gloeothece verrucosa PCC 7822]
MTIAEKVSKPKSVPFKKQPLRIIAIGDSLIYGYGDPVGGGWVERLRRQWMSPDSSGHALYNLGIRGDRVCQVLERLEPEYRYRGEFRNQFPDLILLSVGVNDTPQVGHEKGRNLTEFATFQGQLHTLLQQAKNLCPALFIGMVPVDEQKMPFIDCLYYTHREQYRYKEATKQACQKYHIPYLDIFDLWMARGETWRTKLLGRDGLHPNELGYQALLEDILNWTPVLQLP